jgi:hypothetical protein
MDCKIPLNMTYNNVVKEFYKYGELFDILDLNENIIIHIIEYLQNRSNDNKHYLKYNVNNFDNFKLNFKIYNNSLFNDAHWCKYVMFAIIDKINFYYEDNITETLYGDYLFAREQLDNMNFDIDYKYNIYDNNVEFEFKLNFDCENNDYMEIVFNDIYDCINIKINCDYIKGYIYDIKLLGNNKNKNKNKINKIDYKIKIIKYEEKLNNEYTNNLDIYSLKGVCKDIIWVYKMNKWKNKYYVSEYLEKENDKNNFNFRCDVTKKVLMLFCEKMEKMEIKFGDNIIRGSNLNLNEDSYILSMEECSIPIDEMPIEKEINKDSCEYKNIIKINEPLNFGLLINFENNPGSNFTLQLNRHDRFDRTDSNYFNVVVPYQHYNNVPNDGINVYLFIFDPYKSSMNEGCNFNNIDKITCMFGDKLKNENMDRDVNIYFRTGN